LEATVEAQQEAIQQLLPSRRRVLQAGGLLAGGGVLGALTADRASADVVGQVGTSQDRVDVFGGTVDANSVKTEQLSNGPHFAGAFGGSTPEDRLSTALSLTPNNATIVLEQANYATPPDVNTSVSLIGVGASPDVSAGTVISGDWELNKINSLSSITIDSATVTLDRSNAALTDIVSTGTIDVLSDRCIISDHRAGTVNFDSNTLGSAVFGVNTTVTGNTTDNTSYLG